MFDFLKNLFKPTEYVSVNSDAVERQRLEDLHPMSVVEQAQQIESFFEEIKNFDKNRSEKWDRRFLDLAEHISSWSLDPSTKVGAVIVDQNRRIVSVGYNGLPQGVSDSEERLNNREFKYATTVHGEMNAILFAGRSVKDCTLYTFPFMPCSRCCSMVIQSGIKRVVSPFNDNERWKESFKIAEELFKEACVELVLYDPK